ncbi:hypothetical protein NDU88_001846 [Pleurodeles waltl]|uniref:Uncharacterized protein n=1 Tax=Pleurodeles waltl TaxID=8319 RepID=A0AAV7UVW4_PLEWA|nr:hypothetical protein NDU88_001846 [Pleurodeles waltl]
MIVMAITWHTAPSGKELIQSTLDQSGDPEMGIIIASCKLRRLKERNTCSREEVHQHSEHQRGNPPPNVPLTNKRPTRKQNAREHQGDRSVPGRSEEEVPRRQEAASERQERQAASWGLAHILLTAHTALVADEGAGHALSVYTSHSHLSANLTISFFQPCQFLTPASPISSFYCHPSSTW